MHVLAYNIVRAEAQEPIFRRLMKYTPLAIANELIGLAAVEGVTHMQLQKLVYIVHGNWLRGHDIPCVDENPQVWQYGPVFGSLYHKLKDHKNDPITSPVDEEFVDENDREVKELVKRVWAKFRTWSGPKLSDVTHRPGSPWHEVAKRFDFQVPRGTGIPAEEIKEYFRETSILAV